MKLLTRLARSVHVHWPDILSMGVLAAVAAWLSVFLSGSVHALTLPHTEDFWFGADSPRVFSNMTVRLSDHYRTSVHPLFSLAIATPTIALTIAGLSPIDAMVSVMAVAAALATILLYLTIRLITPILDAAVYVAVFLSSAAFMFWFSVPETFAWGGVSVLSAVLAAAAIPYSRWPAAVVAVSAFSLSITVTNWMAGLMTALLSQPLRQAVRLSIYAFALVAFLTSVQYAVFPTAGKFLAIKQERQFIVGPKKYLSRTASFFINSVVMPKPELRPMPFGRGYYLSIDTADLRGTHDLLGMVGTGAWVVLLGVGSWAVIRRGFSRLGIAVGAILLGQFALHLVYGDQPFLYSAHYVPLLVLLAAFASTTRARWPALGLAVLIITAGGINNFNLFQDASALIPLDTQVAPLKIP